MKRIVHTVSIILAVLLAAGGGYYGGRRSVQPLVGTTFYAVIEEIRENRLLVQGLEINDINGRGTFELAVGDKTELIWRGVPITMMKRLIRVCPVDNVKKQSKMASRGTGHFRRRYFVFYGV